MPRRPRVFVDGATYHIYCRTARGDAIFRRAEDARDFLAVAAEVKRDDGFAVLAWCVMPTHYHLVVRTGAVPLWKSMRLIQGRFAKSFNRRHDVVGPVWQGRYKAKLIIGERYLRQAIVYVHTNPVTAKLAGSPGAFRWSGHRELQSESEVALLDVDEMLLAFGGRRGEARSGYLQAVAGAAAAPAWPASVDRLPWWRPGSDETIVPSPESPRLDALGAGTAERPAVPIGDFIARAAAVLGTTVEELRAPGSGREMTRRREALALVGSERFRFRVADLAAQLRRSPSVVSRWGVAAVRRRRDDGAFRDRVAALASALTADHRAEASWSEPREVIVGADPAFID